MLRIEAGRASAVYSNRGPATTPLQAGCTTVLAVPLFFGVRARSSANRASVFGTEGRGFESLRARQETQALTRTRKSTTRATPVPQGEIASSRRRHELHLEAAFMRALTEHFAEHGEEAIKRVYNRRLAAKCLPPRPADDAITAEDVRALAGLARAVRQRFGSQEDDDERGPDVH